MRSSTPSTLTSTLTSTSTFHHRRLLPTLITTLLLLSKQCHLTSSCTVFLVGKNATVNGSVMVTHSNDGEFDTDPRLVKVPAADYPVHDDSKRPIYFSPESYPRYVGFQRGIPEYYPKQQEAASFIPIGYIPQVKHTFAYIEDTYGAVNEMQVGIGESTCSGIFGAIPLGVEPNGTALFSIDELSRIVMERASTAREAILIMGELAVEYGFYGAGEFEGTAESLAVSDTQEAWIFHILPDPTGKSAIWAAQRIPSDSISILANMFIIRHVDPTDSDNFLMSESVHSVAKAYGWWNNVEENGLLDFTKIYSDGEYAHKYYSGRRMWGGYHLACPSQNFPSEYSDLQSDPVYPVYAKPDYLISEMDMFRFHRYTYQGTQFDLSAENNLAGGPFGTPDRWKAGKGEDEVKGNWERSIGLYRTSDTYVVVSREQHAIQQGEENNGDKKDSDGGLGAILWFASASPLGSVFTPFIVGLSDIPKSYRSGHQKVFDRTSAFWAACYVANVANLKWSYAIQDVQSRQNQLEKSSLEMIQQMDEHYAKTRDMDKVESIYFQNIQTIVASLWSLSDEIMFKYASGFVNELPERMGQMVGYPAWWLKKVGFQDGPPPPPTEPKCCNPSPHDSDRLASRNNNISSKNLRKEKEEKNKRNSEVELDYRQPMLTGKAAMKQFVLNQNQINTPTSTK